MYYNRNHASIGAGEHPPLVETAERGTHMGPIRVQACLIWDTVKAIGMLTDEVPFLSDEKAANCARIKHIYHACPVAKRASQQLSAYALAYKGVGLHCYSQTVLVPWTSQ